MTMDKNPYHQDTPEWQLWEQMRSAESLERSHLADADRHQRLAIAQREKAERYREALAKLGEG